MIMPQKKNRLPKLNKQKDCKTSLLDLPDVTLDCILERLSPQDLCRVAHVCTHLRTRSRSDYLWEKHVQQKWSRLIGEVARREWRWHTTKIISSENILLRHNLSRSCGTFSGVWPFLGLHSYLEYYGASINLIKNCSKMALFICLETGRFWLPAQVFEIAPILFSCYDALVSYDSRADTFRARSPIGRCKMIESDIQWDRLRLPPPETFVSGYYNSNCLSDLKPGDHIEIQCRVEKDDPYDWRFAVVGHLEPCDKGVNHCRCQQSDTLVVEFKQFPHVCPLRRAVLKRNVHEEQRAFFLFGGIRKLEKEEEIEKWNNLLISKITDGENT